MIEQKSSQEILALPLEDVNAAVDAMFLYLRNVLYNPRQAKLDPLSLAEPFRDLAQGLLFIGQCIEESRTLARDLGRGNLDSLKISPDNDIASGLKDIQSTLKHISWQVNQVAKGDYNQRLSFAGEFSDSINGMIEQLKERDDALKAEIKLNKQIATDSRSTVLLLEGITKSIAEWIVVIDRTTFEWLYTNHTVTNYLPNKESFEELKGVLKYKLDEYNKQSLDGRPDAETPLQSLVELMGEDGSLSQFFSVVGYPLTYMERRAVVLILIDVTEEQRKRRELEQIANYDALTGAYSRYFGMQTYERWVDEKQDFTLAFVDMDGLKYVNDTFGHQAGDDYIKATAQALASLNEQTTLCRLGGDEFMLLLRHTPTGLAQLRLEEIRKELNADCEEAYDRSFSFGLVSVDKNNTKSASLLLSIADESMYEDKRSRKQERRAQS